MKLYETLEKQLKKEINFVSDNGELKKWVVMNKAQNYDTDLIALLLEDKELKEKFFIDIKGTLVFNQNLFVQFLEQKNYLNDSYTQYKNKVGLTIDGKYLKQRNEVALVWPFKDCVLEGGQSREEDKREEIFFNETLAQDEITQLLEPKVLTNAKTYDKNGEHEFKGFTRDAELNKKRELPEDTITDNLIIKGNNLLALHSLKKEFAGKVKLIYIDPPYNTGSDSFGYNDNFNHSTWLTFMKNRLEVAKHLLSEEGCIYIHIDHHQVGYMNVLMDDVFGKNNKVQLISIKTASPAGFKTVNPGPIDVTEYIWFYTKNKGSYKFKKGYVPVGYNKNYNLYLEKASKLSDWKFYPIREKVIESAGFINEKEAKDKMGKMWKKVYPVLLQEFAYTNAENVVSIRDPHKPTTTVSNLMKKSKDSNEIIEYIKENGKPMYLYKGGALAFYSKKMRKIDGKPEITELLTDFWNHISWAGIAREGGVKLKNGKKPEKLLKQIIELTTNENDIVLDYHLGSGTTTAVAHKMNRQYIGIEQLNYGKNDSVIRLQNVIKSDTSGISKAINWQGGGSFTYLELKKYNQTFIDQIEEVKDSKGLLKIWEQMKAKSFLDYNVDIQKQDEHIEEFKKLELAQQKQHLIELLDKNQLYVNLSSINDKDFDCSTAEKKVTADFYQLKKD
ncbi:DNA methyltransferase [Lutibacter sp.]|uniref:DNA methyltransferase n=1 Tax=Lutibacter sp. TaxID=1925666 RepID=UPI0035644E64